MRFKSLFIVLIMIISYLPPSQQYLSESEVQYSSEANCNANRNSTWTVGLIYCSDGIKSGYTLFSPMASSTSYLIDEYGREVHTWTSPGGHKPGLSAYLLEDGSLLRTANLGVNQPGEFSGGGSAGKIEKISWDGILEWSWTYSSEYYRSHHDIEPMPNGNILMIAWEYRSELEATEAGKYQQDDSNRAIGSTSVWPDQIIEVKPIGTDDAEIVWKWSFWDHLIQDYDSSMNNFGVISEHPELIDVNFIDSAGSASGGRDWLHCNGIDYNSMLDQIAISCKNTNEIYIIDHSTTTEQAAGHVGGNSGMGGDFLYRYGNPQSYDRGTVDDKVLFSQHDVKWIEDGYQDGGKLMIFNNGNGREPLYSSVDIIETPINGSRYFIEEGKAYGPNNLSWNWNIGVEMYSHAISGSTRLSNGNTLITFGTQGTFIEVDYYGNIVWKYISPINNLGIMDQGDSIFEGNGNKVFKVSRIDANHNSLKGRDLQPSDYIENWVDNCPNQISLPYDVDGDGCIDDSDNDGIIDTIDGCNGYDDNIDVDNDSIPDDCDLLIDSDGDGISNDDDNCIGYDDNQDLDNDSIPDDCDEIIDSDNDFVSNSNDQCEGYNDSIDVDNDSIPDGCDEIIDSDSDGVSDSVDSCMGFDDFIDIDNDSIPDGCDSLIDSDKDGVSDDNDKCEGGNDSIDVDYDFVPDFCDNNIQDNVDENIDQKSTKLDLLRISSMILAILIFVLLIRRKSSHN